MTELEVVEVFLPHFSDLIMIFFAHFIVSLHLSLSLSFSHSLS